MPLADPEHPTGDAETIAFLEGGALGGAVRRIDTHAAHVFLAGDRAWKLKRPVDLGYLDFSSPARRKAALEAELVLNRRTAPALYLGLHAVTRAGDGALAIDGTGEPVDWLLEMRRFPDDALLDRIAREGRLEDAVMLRLAERLHDFHVEAAIERGEDGAARLARVIEGNADSLAACGDAIDRDAARALVERQRAQLRRHAALLDARAAQGRVRHCHGDLHLANIALIKGEPVPFDCLEFDAGLATTDVLYDLAFLLMDLWHHGLTGPANRLFNRYLDLSGVDEAGVAAMPLFLSVRATIRAHVAGARAMEGGGDAARAEAAVYLALAARLLDPVAPALVAVGGRSGTGKSTLAAALGGEIGRAPGARILRSDVLRKRLAGLAPEARLPAAAYTVESSAAVYAALSDEAAALLAEGGAVIADAAFLKREERDAVAAVAKAAGAGFLGLWLQAGIDTRIARVKGRRDDASDADARVVRLQARQPVGPLAPWRRIDASGGTEATMAEARRLLAARFGGSPR